MIFSDETRLLLANQFRILEQVDPTHALKYQRFSTALLQGFEREYARVWAELAYPVADSVCGQVQADLRMFASLQQFHPEAAFPGYSPDTEPGMLAYSRFLLSADAYSRFAVLPDGPPTARGSLYRDMHELWNEAEPMTQDVADRLQALYVERLSEEQP